MSRGARRLAGPAASAPPEQWGQVETKEVPCPGRPDPSSGRPTFSSLGLTFPKAGVCL